MKRNPPKVVVTAPNWLGDAVMSLPLIGMLSAGERVRVSVLAPQYTARAYWGVDGVEELLVYSRSRISRRLLARARIFRRLGASASVLLSPSFSSAIPPFLAHVPIRAGYPTDGRRVLLNLPVPADGLRDEHLSLNYLRLGRRTLRRMGIEEGERFSAPRIRVFSNERESIEKRLAERGAPRGGFCLVVPGAMYGPAKSWPERAFREAVRKLARQMPVVLGGSAGEGQRCARIASGVAGVWDLCGATTMGEFFALIERANVLLANDSGAAHVAGSLKTPAVVVFGSTSPRWTAPLGDAVAIAREPVPCSPCFLKKCPTRLECFEGVTPEVVCEHVMRMKKWVDNPTPGG